MLVMKNGASGLVITQYSVHFVPAKLKSKLLNGPVHCVTLLLGCVPQLLGPTK